MWLAPFIAAVVLGGALTALVLWPAVALVVRLVERALGVASEEA